MDISSKKPLIAGAAIVGLPLLAWLAFGFFGIQAAFIDNEVNESADDLFTSTPAEVTENESDGAGAQPEALAEQAVEEAPTEEAPAEEAPAEEAVEEAPAEEAPAEEAPAEEAVEEAPAEEAVEEAPAEEAPAEEAVEEAPAEEAPAEEAVEEAPAEEAPVEEAPAEEAVEEAPAEEEAATPGEIVTLSSGNFVGINDYAVAGDAFVLNNGTEQRFLRFENFASDNGPDLKVYLRAANGDFVSLGDLSGNIGDQNYEIPVDVDLSVFSSVEIWCERFNSGFGFATLS